MSGDFKDHVLTKISESAGNVLGEPQFWQQVYEAGVYWASIISTVGGVGLIIYMLVCSLIVMRHMYIVTGSFFWFFEFHGDDMNLFRKFEDKYPYVTAVAIGLLPFVAIAGLIFLLILIIPYLWPIAAIATIPVCFVYSGYRTRKKHLFLESLKGESE